MMTVSPTRPAVATIAESAQSAMGNRKAGFYRHDLDGLRGIAIALVAMFHVWFGRVSGGVDVFLALSGFFFGGKLLRAALNPAVVTVAGARSGPAGPPVAAGTGRGAGRVRGVDHPDSAGDPLGDLRRPEPGQPRLLPELGAGQHGGRLSAGRRSGQPAAAHLVDVGAGPVLYRFPGAGFRIRVLFRRRLGDRLRTTFVLLLSALTVASFVYAIFAHQANQATAYYNSFARAWELLLGVLVGALVPYIRWPMWLRTADRHRRPGSGAVLRRAHRRRQGIPRTVGAGARRGGHAVHPGRRQPAGRSDDA